VIKGLAFYLFVGPLVFFVYDDEAKIGNWRKQGAPRADYHVVVAVANLPPLVEFLSVGEAAVGDRYSARETGVDPLHSLRCQDNLRNKENDLPTLLHHLGNGSKIDFRLSAARHAMQ
jgi:hypothetical protein